MKNAAKFVKKQQQTFYSRCFTAIFLYLPGELQKRTCNTATLGVQMVNSTSSLLARHYFIAVLTIAGTHFHTFLRKIVFLYYLSNLILCEMFRVITWKVKQTV